MDQPCGGCGEPGEEVHALTLMVGAVIYVTHDIKDAIILADKIYVMNKGKITMTAKPSEIYIGADGTAKYIKEDE